MGRITGEVNSGYVSVPAPGRQDQPAPKKKALLHTKSNDYSEKGVLWQDDTTEGGRRFKMVANLQA